MVLVLTDDLPVLTPGLVLRLVRQGDALQAPGGAEETRICECKLTGRSYTTHLLSQVCLFLTQFLPKFAGEVN